AFKRSAPDERTAFAPLYDRAGVAGQLVNQHEAEIVSRPLVFTPRITKANNQTHKAKVKSKKVKTAACDSAGREKRKLRLICSSCLFPFAFLLLVLFLLFLGRGLALFFLLALADYFGLRGNLAFDRRHDYLFFLDDADGSDDGIRVFQDFDLFVRGNV